MNLAWYIIKRLLFRSARTADLDPVMVAMKQSIQGACAQLRVTVQDFDIQLFEEFLLHDYHRYYEKLLYPLLQDDMKAAYEYLTTTFGRDYGDSYDIGQILRNFLIYLRLEILKYPVLRRKVEDYQRAKLLDMADRQVRLVESIFDVLREVKVYRPFFASNEQISNLQDGTLRQELEKALSNLNIDNVDMGLLDFAKTLENVLKDYLQALRSSVSTYTVQASDLQTFNNMIECAARNGIISNKSILHFLREQRNERAHGRVPPLLVREELMRLVPHLSGLYLEYIFMFVKKKEDFLAGR